MRRDRPIQNPGLVVPHFLPPDGPAGRRSSVNHGRLRLVSDARSAGVVADAVSKLYGATVALLDVSMTLPFGRIVVIRGPNGAGKSTLLRVLAGLTAPTAGRVRIVGASMGERRTAFVGHAGHLFDQLTPLENLELAARLGNRPVRSGGRWLAELGLSEWAATPCGRLSAGVRRRAAIGRALVLDPAVLLVDEPFAELDGEAADRVAAALAATREAGALVVLASHETVRSDPIADSTIRLVKGRVEPGLSDAGDATIGRGTMASAVP